MAPEFLGLPVLGLVQGSWSLTGFGCLERRPETALLLGSTSAWPWTLTLHPDPGAETLEPGPWCGVSDGSDQRRA